MSRVKYAIRYKELGYTIIKHTMKGNIMNSIELKIRLDKANETVAKKEKTIERHKVQAEKRLKKLTRFDWIDLNDLSNVKYNDGLRQRYSDLTNGDSLYWDICGYTDKLRDIRDATKKLEDAKQIASNWKERYNLAVKKELMIAKEIPEAFKSARDTLVEAWVESDIRSREKMKKDRSTLEYKEFREIWTYTAETMYTKTDEEFRKYEESEADVWVLDLYNRVKEICGDITDASLLRWGGKCLDGKVVGTKGTAWVNTILAGGYNIQRLHLRTLVHKEPNE